jgi:hypothetical protein
MADEFLQPERFYCSQCLKKEGEPYLILALTLPIVIYLRCRSCAYMWTLEREVDHRLEELSADLARALATLSRA